MSVRESRALGRILQKIAPRIGARVLIEPEWKLVGQITFKNGRRSCFRYNTLDLNPVGSSDVARDKDYANYFMQSLGYPIVPGSKTFYADAWAHAIGALDRTIDAGYEHARSLGFPVVVKPNSGSQGVGVALVHNKREFCKAMRAIFRRDKIALVQQPVRGKDYRLVVLDTAVISAYERVPLNVIGDGKSTILQLLARKQKKFKAARRDTRIRIDDPRISMKLARQGLDENSVIGRGQRVYLLDNANLSTGGDAIDVTDRVHTKFRELAINLTRDMGLRLCGVDLMIDGDIADEPSEYWVLEINAAPGLDHYVTMGGAQEKIVEDLYLEVLKHLER